MDYFKITIRITPFEEWVRDVLSAQLAEKGFESFLETESGMEAFIPTGDYNESDVNQLLKAFEEHHSFHLQKERIESQNWNETWEKNYFSPLMVGGECLIRAPFHKDYPSLKYEIVIEPNMAFGTGNHETTTMMLEAILSRDFTGKTVLDMGCGTGILSILASMKGAGKITAIDIDEWAYKGARENAALNGISNMTVRMGDASLLENEKYDALFANIHKNVLLEDMAAYSKSLKKGGELFMSGFYQNDIPDIKKQAENEGLSETGCKTKNNWVVSIYTKV